MSARQFAAVAEEAGALAGFGRANVSMVLADARADDCPIVYVNEAFERTTGYQRSSVIGRNCRFLQGEETDKAVVDRLRHAIEGGTDVAVDILNYRADGEPFTNRLIVAPITNADGVILYFLGIQKELYPHERTREALDAALGRLRGRVARDLSTLLDGIGAHDGRVEPFGAPGMRRRLECLELVHDAIRAGPGGRPAVEAGSLLSRIAAAIAHAEGRPGLRYTQSLETLDVSPDAAVRLGLLASEVLSNAFRHAFERLDEGSVELRMSRLAGGGLRLTVGDDGVGLPRGRALPDPATFGGRLVGSLCAGLEATLSPVRGAAGTVVVLDVPAGATEI